MNDLIGGFFEWHCLENLSSSESIWHYLHLDPSHTLLLRNARSCLYQLLQCRAPSTVWLPAYSCPSITDAVKEAELPVAYYPLTETLSPKVDFLKTKLREGDAVLAIDYFGQLPDADFLELVESSPDIMWIEDKSQNLSPYYQNWGDYILYSPRKLVGVPDGGILQSQKIDIAEFKIEEGLLDMDQVAPMLQRYEDTQGNYNDVWYQANRAKEQTQKISSLRMSLFSQQLLKCIPVTSLIEKRRKNYACLDKHLSELNFFKNAGDGYCPFGFVISHERRDEIWEHLIRHNIFAQKYWDPIVVDAKAFPEEYALSKRLLTLPCDHRYDEAQMRWIIYKMQEILCLIPT